jgi:hypothetical protein
MVLIMTRHDLADYEAKPVGRLKSMLIHGRSILIDVGHKVLRRRRREVGQVSSDYDQGEWQRQLEARDWERVDSLERYVERAWAEDERISTIDGKLWKIPLRQFYRYRRAWLVELVDRFSGDVDELVEVGSGTGFNLFTLFLEGRWRSLLGLDLSPVGREVSRRVAEHFGIDDRVRFDEIDLTDGDSPGFGKLRGKTVLSYLCLEQLPDHTERVLRNLCRAGPRRVIHVETSFELLRPTSLRDLATISYVWRQDYQRTLIASARRLEAEGLLRIVAVERLPHSPNWRNAPTLLVWDSEPAQSSSDQG